MDKPEFSVTPGVGDRFRQTLHFWSAVRIGNRVETSGQGGWNEELQIPETIEEEIAVTFRNIGLVLANAGATWGHVIHINTYRVGGFPPMVNDTIQDVSPVHPQPRTGLDAVGSRRIEAADDTL